MYCPYMGAFLDQIVCLWRAWIMVPPLNKSCRAPAAAGLLPRRLPRGTRATRSRDVLVPSADRKLKHPH